jgi:hypothetical protein
MEDGACSQEEETKIFYSLPKISSESKMEYRKRWWVMDFWREKDWF